MLIFEKKGPITFDRVNIINFWLIRFILMKTKDTPNAKFVSWIRDDLEKYLYKYLLISAIKMIFKYNMIKMKMSKRNMYKLIVTAIMRSVLTFNLFEDIEQWMKLLLVCRKMRKKLNLEDYKPYSSNGEDMSIPKSEKKSPINISSPQLTLSICATSIFYLALVNSPESLFIASPELSNIQHNC